jgi:hypothetical protein
MSKAILMLAAFIATTMLVVPTVSNAAQAASASASVRR